MKTTATPPPGATRRPPWLKWLLLAAALALVALAGWFGWQKWGGAEKEGELLTAEATRGDLEDAVTATGTLQPKEFVDVGTQVSGQLRKLHVEVGSTVKQGQLLAEIDPSVYRARVDATSAQLKNQRAQLTERIAQQELADAQYRRQRNLMKEEATSVDALQSAEAAADSARAQVASVRAQMEQTESTLRADEANLGYTKIYAPMNGTVVSQAAKQGQTLNANQSAPIVMRIADLSTMTVQAQVSEADVSRLNVGMPVYFTTLGGDGRRYRSTLRQIPPTPTVTNNVVLYDALFDVPNPDGRLMTQMTAQVFFVIASASDVVQVPVAALKPLPREARAEARDDAPRKEARKGEGRVRREGGGSENRIRRDGGRALVQVVKPDGSLEDRQVTVGVMTRVAAEITSGLMPGEKVVVGRKTAADAAKPGGPQNRSALTPNTPRMGGGRP